MSNKDKQETKPTVQPDIKWVRNNTDVTKSIGSIDIEPGQKAQIDVRSGTLAHRLIEQGQLVLVSKGRQAVDKTSDAIQRMLTPADAEPPKATLEDAPADLSEVSLYKCPWCGESFNQSDMARGHIVTKHHEPICRYYSDVVAGFFRPEGSEE